jgi:hypothetical protein
MPKTGSSAIQSWLSTHSTRLRAEENIEYADLNPDAKLNKITSGNGQYFVEQMFKGKRSADYSESMFVERLETIHFGTCDTALVSSESLSSAPEPAISSIRRVCAEHNISVSIVAVLRNVYDHCWSAYQQNVKRNGYYKSFQTFSESYSNPQINCLRQWNTHFDDIVAIHYESSRSDIVGAFARALGLSLKTASDTVTEQVNRSLSSSELELLLQVNQIASEMKIDMKNVLSDALIYASPLKRSSFRYFPEVAASLSRRFTDDIIWAREKFPALDNLQVDVRSNMSNMDDAGVIETSDALLVIRALMRRILHFQRRLEAQNKA